jgi:hypothetical protein
LPLPCRCGKKHPVEHWKTVMTNMNRHQPQKKPKFCNFCNFILFLL